MSMITGNEPAMPRDHRYQGHNGLTIRQQFAAMAMQGLVSSTKWEHSPMGNIYLSSTAKHAVELADALIAELNKESEVSNG